MARWQFILARSSGAAIGELAAARTRRLEFHLDGPASIAWTMPADHPQTALVAELETDLIVYRDGLAVFSGRCGTSNDTLTANAATTDYTAVDYRGMLDRRIIWQASRTSFRQVDQAEIAWALVADSQARPGGDLGISRGQLPAGAPRDRDYQPGKKIGEALDQLGRVIDGFDWDVDPARRLNVYSPRRGRSTGIELVWGREIAAMTRNLTPSAYANALRFNGADGLSPVEIESASIGPGGRFEASIGNPDLLLQESVNERAAAELDAAGRIQPGYHLTLMPGWWNPAALWLGDTAAVDITAGRLQVSEPLRVEGLTVTLDDAGGETVDVSLGADQTNQAGRLADYQSRLEVLERGNASYLPDAPVGVMFAWPGTTPPRTWMWCDGALLAVASYGELFDVIGYTFSGGVEPGPGLFALPDLRARTMVGTGTGGPGLTDRQTGATGGAETVALSASETGYHSHPVNLPTVAGSGLHTHPATTAFGAGDHVHTATTTAGGGDHAHSGTTTAGSGVHTHPVPIWYGGLVAQSGAGAHLWVPPPGSMDTGTEGNHQHVFDTGGAPHQHNLTTGGAPHQHTLTTGDETNHQHTVIGPTDSGGGGGAHQNMAPFIAIGQIIRVLPPWRQYAASP